MAAKKKKKTKKASKAKAVKKAPAKKSKTAKKSVKAVKKTVKKTKAVKKTKKPAAKKSAKKTVKAVKKAAPRKAKKVVRKKKQVVGEGDYAATRKFDKDQASFVEKNKAKIPALGKEAEDALDGPQGDELRDAEAAAAGRSRDTF
jgi:hypothetical protein